MLSYYADRFSCVELNSTFYAIPSSSAVASMVKETPSGFRFTAKLHRDITHGTQVDQTTCQRFLEAIEPLIESGKFGCVLAQFPWSFRKTQDNVSRVRDLKKMMVDIPTVIEFRNAEWITGETFNLLRELGMGFCSVDEPRLGGLMPPVAEATSNIGYIRFHGRNAAKWWQHDQPHERYDYLYTEDELGEWIPRIQHIASKTDETYVFFNNHYRGKSVENARMLARMLNVPLPKPEQDSDDDQLRFVLSVL